MMKKKVLTAFFIGALILISLIYPDNFSYIRAENQTEIDKAVSYLKTQPQNPWNTMALSGTGQTEGFDYLKSVPSDQKSAAGYAKYILALTSAGKNPASLGNENYVERLKSFYQNNQFGEEYLINDDVWAILALGAVGQKNMAMVQSAKDYVLNHQNSDGGWSYSISVLTSDTNDTASAIMALLEAGVSNSSPAMLNAVNYLKAQQNNDGGFPYMAQSSSDTCSDSWVISSVLKLGQDPASQNWQKTGKNAIDHLKSLQDQDGGFWWQAEGDNKFCSPYALIALSENFYPVVASYNLHNLRIEGKDSNICDIEVSGATALDLVIKGSEICGYDYLISEYPGIGLYLAKVNEEDNWMYMVNGVSPIIGADSYYLGTGDDVLWFSADWLENGWFQTESGLTKTDDLAQIQVKYYNIETSSWQKLETEGVKVKIGSSDFTTNSSGIVKFSLNGLEGGFYQIFVEKQIIDGKGYIRSKKVNLATGEVPADHQVGLKVEIEKVEVQPQGKQGEISFSISPDILDFGKLKPGESSVENLTINNGDSGIYLETEVSGANIFKDNLNINGQGAGIFSAKMDFGQSKNFPVKLTVPLSYNNSFGLLEGELTFWAIKK
ncbi:MAG: prenyltransferase/squalene oxidase repeat-containing protein [Patescibacteria group bacterium]